MVEMTLVGIPILITLILTFETSRGMWIYYTLSYAAREATRFVVVHGQNCQTSPNSCTITPADLGNVVSQAAAGLIPTDLTVTFQSDIDLFTCTLQNLTSGGCGPAFIPSKNAGAAGAQFVIVNLSYPFQFGFFGSNLSLSAYSRDGILF